MLNGKIFLIGIVVGLVLGTIGFYFTLTTFPEMASLLFVFPQTLDESVEIPLEELNKKPTLITNELVYTLLDTRQSEFGIQGEKPLSGGVFVISKLEIENIGKTEISVYGDSWYVQDSKDRIFKPKSFDPKLHNDERLFVIKIPPGFKLVNDIGFEVPSKLELPLYLYVDDASTESKSILLGQLPYFY